MLLFLVYVENKKISGVLSYCQYGCYIINQLIIYIIDIRLVHK